MTDDHHFGSDYQGSLNHEPLGHFCVEINSLAVVRKSSAIVDSERTIQTAFREVADGLAGQQNFSHQIAAQRRVVDSAERRAELSFLRYHAGKESGLELLDAQQQLYTARQTLLDLRRSTFSNAVRLCKALGGGLVEKRSGGANG